MIKKILGLITITIGLINFSNAGYIGYIGQLQNSVVNTSYKVQVNGQGNLLTQYFGAGKRLLQFQDGLYFFWSNTTLPYIYVTSDYDNPDNYSAQGFVNDYMICDYIGLDTGNATNPQNCTRYNIANLSGFLGRYLNGLGNGGYYYYDNYAYNVPNRNVYCGAFTICFSNTDFNNSLCFYGSNGNWGYPCSYSLSYPNGLYGDVTNLSNSLGLEPYFDNINSAVLGNSPGQTIIPTENNTNTNTAITQQCPTIRQIMSTYGNNYNTGLCYNNTTYFNGTSFEQIEKQDIFTIFNDNYQNYINRVSTYRNNCTTPTTQQNCTNAFSGEYKKYSIIANATNSNVDEKRLRNYCNMGLNYDPNATTCVASGVLKEQPTPEERLDDIINLNTGIPTPTTAGSGENNNVFNSLCEEGDEDCYIGENVRDIFGALENIYGKITGIFRERNGVDGIIPDYILRITFVTILFTIILKK